MSMPDEAREALFRELSARVAFEHMVVASLAGSALCGAALFLANTAMLLAKGSLSAGGLLDATVGAVTFAFIAFLVAFAASVAIGAPLFAALEKTKLRAMWPYWLAAFAVSFAALWAISGRLPAIETPATGLFFLPGFVIVFLFGRRMRPVWRAAEEAERATALRIVN